MQWFGRPNLPLNMYQIFILSFFLFKIETHNLCFSDFLKWIRHDGYWDCMPTEEQAAAIVEKDHCSLILKGAPAEWMHGGQNQLHFFSV